MTSWTWTSTWAGVLSSSRTMVARSETHTGWPSAWTMRSSVAMPSSASSVAKASAAMSSSSGCSSSSWRRAASSSVERPVMLVSAALTRSTLPPTPISAMPIGARSKAISKRCSASRPARSARRCSVTSRETTTMPSIVPACVRTGALWMTIVRPVSEELISTLPSWPPSESATICSVAARSSGETISDTCLPTIAAPSMPARSRCGPSSSRQRSSRS